MTLNTFSTTINQASFSVTKPFLVGQTVSVNLPGQKVKHRINNHDSEIHNVVVINKLQLSFPA